MESKQLPIRIEKDVDFVLKNIKLKILGQPHDEVLMMTDSRYKNYKANEDRIVHKDDLLLGKYFGETGSVKYYQFFIPKQLVNSFCAVCMENLENTQEFPKQ